VSHFQLQLGSTYKFLYGILRAKQSFWEQSVLQLCGTSAVVTTIREVPPLETCIIHQAHNSQEHKTKITFNNNDSRRWRNRCFEYRDDNPAPWSCTSIRAKDNVANVPGSSRKTQHAPLFRHGNRFRLSWCRCTMSLVLLDELRHQHRICPCSVGGRSCHEYSLREGQRGGISSFQ
jgi:hypothetical protein